MERVEVKTKAAAEKAIKAGKPIKIVGGKFAIAIASLTGVDVHIAATAEIDMILTNVVGVVAQDDYWTSHVVARESSHVVARESSRVVARESSRVEAWGFSQLQAHGDRVKIEASVGVAVNLWEGAKATGGRQFEVNLSTAQDWCDHYGVRTENGMAIVYKGVGKNYLSGHGGNYTPGTMPEDAAWNGKKGECARGCGLNFSPTPRHTHRFHNNPDHYLECRIALDEMNVHFGGRFPEKCTSRRVAAPLVEVDVDGNRVVAPVDQPA